MQSVGAVNRNYEVHLPEILALPKRVKPGQSVLPDYEVFTDASRTGYGAYLVKCPSDEENSVRWIHESWDKFILNEFKYQVLIVLF